MMHIRSTTLERPVKNILLEGLNQFCGANLEVRWNKWALPGNAAIKTHWPTNIAIENRERGKQTSKQNIFTVIKPGHPFILLSEMFARFVNAQRTLPQACVTHKTPAHDEIYNQQWKVCIWPCWCNEGFFNKFWRSSVVFGLFVGLAVLFVDTLT